MKCLHFRFRFGVWWCRNSKEGFGGQGRTVNAAYIKAMLNKASKDE
jgi:hypothetical protein